jgi:UDP-N-acetylmuramoylalanine--D-glutamate ligase
MTVWQGKHVVIVGAARQGIALARYLASHSAKVTLTDRRPEDELHAAYEALKGLPVDWVLGEHPLNILDGVDLLCPSGGVPLSIPIIVEAQRRGIPLSNDSQIFLETAPCRVVGITGSAGKTTTTCLVGKIAEHARSATDNPSPYSRIWVGGNIGNPLIADLDQMQPDDLAVVELSSFQLELTSCSPHVAAVLNVTPNHLDRHGTMADYTAAKKRILQFQTSEDVAVLGYDDPVARSLQAETPVKTIYFGMDKPPTDSPATFMEADDILMFDGRHEEKLMSRQNVGLLGEHNLLNALAACAIAHAASLPADAMRSGISAYTGLPHRLEFVRSWGGADWYNDSIATAPERAMAAIKSFERPIVLLAGGRDKDLPWEDFAELVHERVDHLVLFGESAEKIAESIRKTSPNGSPAGIRRPFTLERVETLYDAVLAASAIVEPGDVVLLSPGGTSFDEFSDFEARGEAFKKWVLELP